MSKKCGLIALGLGVVAGYVAGKYGDVIVKTVKDSLDKKSVDDLLDELKEDSEVDLEHNTQPDWVKDSYIVLPNESEDDKLDNIENSTIDFPEFLKNLNKKEKELGIDIEADEKVAEKEEVKEEVKEEKPKKRVTKKPVVKKDVKSEDK